MQRSPNLSVLLLFCCLANALSSNFLLLPHSHKRWREKFCLVQTSPADKPKNCLLTYESVILQLTFDTEVGCQWIFSTKDTAGLSKSSTYSRQAKVYILQYFFYYFLILLISFSIEFLLINGLIFLYASLLLGRGLFCYVFFFFYRLGTLSSHQNALPLIRNSLLSQLSQWRW